MKYYIEKKKADIKLIKKDTILLCLECSRFITECSPEADKDRKGAEALYKAGIILLYEYGILFSRRDVDGSYDRDETIEELYTYFDYLRGNGMDSSTQRIIINAIRFLKHKPFSKVMAEEPFQKKQGWLREEEWRDEN